MNSGIYFIINEVNNKIYVGSASQLKRRFATHKHALNQNKHSSLHLQAAWNKYGESNFRFQVVELIECDSIKLIEAEQKWMDWTKCYNRSKGYNSRKLANSNFGYKHSIETKKKFSIAQLGKKQSEESKLKRSIALKGRPLSEENKRNISLANKGRTYKYAPERTRLKGRKLPEETKRKMSVAHKGYEPTKEAIELSWKNRNEKFFNKLTTPPLIFHL